MASWLDMGLVCRQPRRRAHHVEDRGDRRREDHVVPTDRHDEDVVGAEVVPEEGVLRGQAAEPAEARGQGRGLDRRVEAPLILIQQYAT